MPAAAGCPFCAIATGAAPADVVLDDEHVVAFLDRRPLFPGHVLVVPRRHVADFLELPAGLVAPVFRAAQTIARALEVALDAKGSFVATNVKISQSVKHLHVHVVPRRPKDGLRGFFWPRHAYATDEERVAVAARIRAAVEA